ncbi:MerR family transcriptional regulator [Pseudokineococcus sp. 5B2Z-1]|uniref:MerR family transcriptional regulator n=1 Tax=Pseudokineococcus sp. 5B2Z-1 TaxID=3132744 RepID=UPI003095D42B
MDRRPGHDEQDEPSTGAGTDPAADPAAVAAPTLKVAAVARRLGVAPATLRTWARRYDLGPSAHTAGAHRQYSLEDLERLMVMRRMTLEGYSPAEAARVAVQSARATSAAPSAHDPSSSAPAQAPSQTSAQADPRPPGGSRVHDPSGTPVAPARGEAPAPRGATPSVRSLARAAMALQAGECQRLLEAHMAVGGVVEAWTALVRPVLEALSDRVGAVAPGRSPVALLEAALLAALRAAVEAEPAGGPAVLVLRPCAPGGGGGASAGGATGDLLSHVVAAALREEGAAAAVLPGAHAAERVAAVGEQLDAAVLVVVADAAVDAAAAEETARLVDPAGARVVLAGRGWAAPLPAPVVADLGDVAATALA